MVDYVSKDIEQEVKKLYVLLIGLLFIFLISFGIFVYLNVVKEKSAEGTPVEQQPQEYVQEPIEQAEQTPQPESPEPTQAYEQPEPTEVNEPEEQVQPEQEAEENQNTPGGILGTTSVTIESVQFSVSEDQTSVLQGNTPIISLEDAEIIKIGAKDPSTVFVLTRLKSQPTKSVFYMYKKVGDTWQPKRLYTFISVYKMVNFYIPQEALEEETPHLFYLFLVLQQKSGFRFQVRKVENFESAYQIKYLEGQFERIKAVIPIEDGVEIEVVADGNILKTEFTDFN